MSDINNLNHEEKVFLAGAIKYMIAVDGDVKQVEVEKIPDLFPEVAFDDYGACLNEFDMKVRDLDGLWGLAKKIVLEKPRDFILQCLYDISLLDGFAAGAEMKFLKKLSLVWEKKELL
jgi:hypothetical protein